MRTKTTGECPLSVCQVPSGDGAQGLLQARHMPEHLIPERHLTLAGNELLVSLVGLLTYQLSLRAIIQVLSNVGRMKWPGCGRAHCLLLYVKSVGDQPGVGAAGRESNSGQGG